MPNVTNSVAITGSNFPPKQEKGNKHPTKNVAKLKTMLIADPGMAFTLKIDYDETLPAPEKMYLNWWIGYKDVEHYKYHTRVWLQLPNGRADLENDITFVLPFVDAEYGTQNVSIDQNRKYSVQVGIYLCEASSPCSEDGSNSLEYFDIPAEVDADDIDGSSTFQYTINSQTPATYSPVTSGENAALYQNIWSHPLGISGQIGLPNIELDGVTFEILPENNAAYSCKITMRVLDGKTNLSGAAKAGFWLPYAKISENALTSLQIKVTPSPFSGIANLIETVEGTNMEFQEGEVSISL